VAVLLDVDGVVCAPAGPQYASAIAEADRQKVNLFITPPNFSWPDALRRLTAKLQQARAFFNTNSHASECFLRLGDWAGRAR
jgi:hypothetical protein